MPIKIMIDPAKVGARVMNVFDQDVLPKLSEEILADCNEYCKEDQQTLIWETPYAKRQYCEIKTSLTPGRTWKWCETARRKHKERWKKNAERWLKSKL